MSMQKYEFIRKLDDGGFSKVMLGRDVQSKKKVAIKILKKNDYDDESIVKREVAIMRAFNHTHIVKCYDLLQDDDKYYIIMDYVKGQTLINYISDEPTFAKGLPETKAREYFAQLLSAISYCHSQFVSHRDLKLENILVNAKTDKITLVDFGLSTWMHADGSRHDTWCGSPFYIPPEIYNHDTYTSPQVDIWSLGIVLYAMLSSRFPFGGNDSAEILANTYSCRYYIPSWVPDLAADLINNILRHNPQERATLEQIRTHEWMQPYGPIDLQIPKREQCLSINLLIIEKMENLGFDGDEAMISLRHGEVNEYSSVYHDLRDRIFTKSKLEESRDIPHIISGRRGKSEPDLRTNSDPELEPGLVSPGLARNGKVHKNHIGRKFLQKLFDHK